MVAKHKFDNPDAVLSAYQDGESVKALAERYQCSRSAVSTLLRDNGIPLRGRGSAMLVRMNRTSESERKRLASAANAARRGNTDPIDRLCRRALTRQRRRLGVSQNELALAERLRNLGIEAIPQQAVGPFNVDLGAWPIAVELFGGGWHAYDRHARRTARRYRFLHDAGWSVMIIWVDRANFPITDGVAPLIASFRSDIVEGREEQQYRVIRGDGMELRRGSESFGDIAALPSKRRAIDKL